MEGRDWRLRRADHNPRWFSGFDLGAIVYAGILVLTVFGSYFVYSRLGMQSLATFLIGSLFAIIFTFVSFRSLLVPFVMWVVAVGGFRFLFMVYTPILPDLSLERMLMVWLGAVFMIMITATGMKLRRPYTLEYLLSAHALYILIRLYMHDFSHFHVYSMSIMVPYAGFFFAKNIIDSEKKMRVLLMALLFLEVYYYITSIAEQYQINWLIWPRFILEKTWFLGRSSGPFRNSGIFGNAMGMLLPIHLYFLYTSKRPFVRFLLYVSFILSIIGLFFSYTRGSWLAGTVGLVAVAYFGRRHYMKYIMPAVFVVPLAGLLFLGASQSEFLKQRFQNEDNISGRAGTAVTILRVWRDNPIFGCGSYRYLEVSGNYVAPVDIPGLPKIRFQHFRHNAPHDMYWGPLAEDGLFGAALQASIYFVIIRRFLRRARYAQKGDRFALLYLPLMAGIFASYFVGGLTISYRHTSILGTLFYVSAGIMDAYDPERQSQQGMAQEAGKW